jgi:hypothetical protein
MKDRIIYFIVAVIWITFCILLTYAFYSVCPNF